MFSAEMNLIPLIPDSSIAVFAFPEHISVACSESMSNTLNKSQSQLSLKQSLSSKVSPETFMVLSAKFRQSDCLVARGTPIYKHLSLFRGYLKIEICKKRL